MSSVALKSSLKNNTNVSPQFWVKRSVLLISTKQKLHTIISNRPKKNKHPCGDDIQLGSFQTKYFVVMRAVFWILAWKKKKNDSYCLLCESSLFVFGNRRQKKQKNNSTFCQTKQETWRPEISCFILIKPWNIEWVYAEPKTKRTKLFGNLHKRKKSISNP